MSDESSKKSSTKTLASAKTDVIKSSLMLIDALAGHDRITGESLGQTIYGGSGNDMLQGAGGNDTLWGDGSSTAAAFVAGRDTFVFENTLLSNGVDTVMDFGIAGHKTAGVLQAGSFVADTLDLSRVKFTGPASLASNDDGDDHDGDDEGKDGDDHDDNDEGDDDFHITAANVNDYVTIKGGELYIDIDGLGAGKSEVWAHLEGVAGGDLVNLKFDDFSGQIEAKPGFDLSLQRALNSMDGSNFVLFDGDFSVDRSGAKPVYLYEGKADTSAIETDPRFLDIVVLDAATVANLGGTQWSINGQKALGTIDVSTWTVESVFVNELKFFENAYGFNADLNVDGTVDFADALIFDAGMGGGNLLPIVKNFVTEIQTQYANQVLVYFNGAAFAHGDTVTLVGSDQGSEVSYTVLAVEAPVMTSARRANFAENSTGIAYTATASDADAGSTLSYALSGRDAALFTIEAATGAVRFVTAPDFETPTNADKNNVYDIFVTANDGVNYSTGKQVQLTVTDVVELVGVVI